MSRTDKTKPFTVKLRDGDLHWIERHIHDEGRCTLPATDAHDAFEYAPGRCWREFEYTGTQVCCCPMCHGDTRRERRRQRRDGKAYARRWRDEY